MPNNNSNTINNIKVIKEVTSMDIQKNQENRNHESVQSEGKVEKTETEQKTVSSQKTRRSKEEQLQLALEKKQALERKIQRYEKELRDKNQKNRNRGLILLGIVVEQNLKQKFKTAPNQGDIDWWLSQHIVLPDKDQEVYISFVRSLAEEKKC